MVWRPVSTGKTGPIVAAGASSAAQMPGGNCISRMTGPGPPSVETDGEQSSGLGDTARPLLSSWAFVQCPDSRLEPCSLNQAWLGEPATELIMHQNLLTSVVERGS